jgi:hypothetical protein
LARAKVDEFKRRFGDGPAGERRLTPEECEKRKREMLKALWAAEEKDRSQNNLKSQSD